MKLGNYDETKDGDVVVAIGHPFGLNYTATQGVISKVDRIRDGVKYIQIDAAINPGNVVDPWLIKRVISLVLILLLFAAGTTWVLPYLSVICGRRWNSICPIKASHLLVAIVVTTW